MCDNNGTRTCPVCNGRPQRTCIKCSGKKKKPCSPCAGKGELRTALVVRRTVTPSASLRYAGDVSCPAELFRGWEQDNDFSPTGRFAAEGDSILDHAPKVPQLARAALATVAKEDLAAADSRRVVRHTVEISCTEAVYAQYKHGGEEFECWLLGSQQRLHAPVNPVTEVFDASLATVRALADEGQRRQAAMMLRDCQAMGRADPYCARRLEEAAETLPDDLGEGGASLPWLWIGVGAGLLLLILLGLFALLR
jgi:hypothetical protein